MQEQHTKDRKLKVLLIDDDDIFRGYVDTLLEEEGFEVTQACNGNEAIDRFNEGSFDLIITDIIMPGKEGLETIREIRQSTPELPIVAVSGYSGTPVDDYLNHAKVFGATSTFRKPFHPLDFLEEIRKLTTPLD
jgi:CheY-like chemotaxis protein